MKRIFLGITVITLIFTACKKQGAGEQKDEIITSGELDTYPPEADPWTRAKNNENPYDANGYYHNVSLDYIFGHISTDSSHGNVYAKSLNYLGVQFGSNFQDSVGHLTTAEDSEPWFDVVDDLTRSDFQNAISNLSATAGAKVALNTLLDILTDTNDSHYTDDYDGLKSRLVNWESAVSSSALSSSDKERLLRGGSVARYSTLYWNNYDSIYVEGNTDKVRFLRWLGWALVGAADGIGFFIGNSGCGPACGLLIGAAGSTLGFVIFRQRGWQP